MTESAEFASGFSAYIAGRKVPEGASEKFIEGWWEACDKRERFGEYDSFLSAPDQPANQQEETAHADPADPADQPADVRADRGRGGGEDDHPHRDRGDHGSPVLGVPGRDGQAGQRGPAGGDPEEAGQADGEEGPSAAVGPYDLPGAYEDLLLGRIREADEALDPMPDSVVSGTFKDLP